MVKGIGKFLSFIWDKLGTMLAFVIAHISVKVDNVRTERSKDRIIDQYDKANWAGRNRFRNFARKQGLNPDSVIKQLRK